MKVLMIGWLCGIWCFGASWASAANGPPTNQKIDPSQTVTIPWDRLDARAAALAKQMLVKPTVLAHGPIDTFTCNPEQYNWLLENPDRAVAAWRRLGAKCVSINKLAPGRFGYTDEAGSDLVWETLHQGPGVRIWFAKGKVKASSVLPLVPVKCLLILHHMEAKTPEGTTIVRHRTEVVVHTDSIAANAVTKLMGQTAPKLAEQGLGQLQLFFSALSCYLERHPERVDTLFRPEAKK